MEYEMHPYIVYVKTDEYNRITAVNSSAFLSNTDGWMEIGRGYAKKHHHAQGNYLPKSLYDERGIPHYKLVDGSVVERTQEEIEADYVPPEVQPTAEELLQALMEGIANA